MSDNLHRQSKYFSAKKKKVSDPANRENGREMRLLQSPEFIDIQMSNFMKDLKHARFVHNITKKKQLKLKQLNRTNTK
jgi:hypothetical protein